MGRHNNPTTNALVPPPVPLWGRSRRPDPAAPSAYAPAGAAPSAFGRRAPEEGVGRPVVLVGVAQQASAGGWQADGVDEILQDAVLHVG